MPESSTAILTPRPVPSVSHRRASSRVGQEFTPSLEVQTNDLAEDTQLNESRQDIGRPLD